VTSISHFGICVSDLDRAIRFYCDGLGFQEGAGIELADQLGHVMGLKDFALQTRMLSLNGATIELLHFSRSRDPVIASELRRMNHTGLTHLALSVDDVDAVARSAVAHGGMVFPGTRAVFESPDGPIKLLYCADPDHTRIELINYPKVSG
jgi:catechol 2,3-dioxygenase-like lactoylglutathione lyase family enzyme